MTIDPAEFRALLAPFSERGYFARHTRWHLLGGAALYLLLQSVALVGIVSLLRQEVLREAKGPREFPLYAIVWDTVAAVLAAALIARVWP